MNKAFTLIELLAVILILGIIALIAIPTVTNIISESKQESFKVTVSNISASVEQNCQLEILKGLPQT
ncbi:MAG: prepilin-type N-terminal cleavage/methylation domain-containing protein, partial [Bacilli bacterium]